MKKWSNNDFLAQKMVEGAEQEEKEYENTRNLMEACLLSAQNSPITEDEALNLFPLIQSFVSRARASEGDVESLKFLVGCVMSFPFSPTIAFEGAFGNNWRSKMNEKWRMDLLLENNQKGADALYALRVYSETLFDCVPPELVDLRHKAEQTMRVLLKDRF